MVSAFSAGCPADRTGGGGFRQGSLSMRERLPLPPLVFPLIFNKQELRLSATGPQFVPTTKKKKHKHGNGSWKSLSSSKGPSTQPSSAL